MIKINEITRCRVNQKINWFNSIKNPGAFCFFKLMKTILSEMYIQDEDAIEEITFHAHTGISRDGKISLDYDSIFNLAA